MESDWKDKLNSLRGTFDSPFEDNIEAENVTSSKEEISQSTPLRVILDKKGRNGKIATIVEGFAINEAEVSNIAREIKKKIGVGGSSRGSEILIQGDHKKTVANILTGLGFKVVF